VKQFAVSRPFRIPICAERVGCRSTVFYDDLSGSRSPFGSNVRSKKLEKIKRSVDEGSEKAEALDYAQWVEDWPLSPACKAIDAETLEKIVTYYAQDYACFGHVATIGPVINLAFY